MFSKTLLLISFAAAGALAADKYTGPVPPKPDIPYLLHASNLVETEIGQARQENRKNESAFIVSGASSPARTPLAEPIFIIDARNVAPDRMEMYQLEVKGGNREVSLSNGSGAAAIGRCICRLPARQSPVPHRSGRAA